LPIIGLIVHSDNTAAIGPVLFLAPQAEAIRAFGRADVAAHRLHHRHSVAAELIALGAVDSMCHPVPSAMVTDQSPQLILFLASFVTHQQYLFANRNANR